MIIPAVIPPIPVALPTPVAIEPARQTDTENKSKQKDSQSDSHSQQNNALSHDSRTVRPETQQAEEAAELQKLALRDREVRAHEAAHKGAAGQYGGATEYTYTRGPNGRQYATGGEVAIDVSVPGDPKEALRKAETIQRAALAPAKPSGQDRAVAARAAQMAAEARAELQQEQTTLATSEGDSTEDAEKPNELDAAYSIGAEQTNEIDLTA